MFESLAAEIKELSIPVDGSALVEVIALWGRLGAKIAAAVGDFDVAQLWDLDGAVSVNSWLRANGMGGRDADRFSSAGRKLRDLPATARAWADGTLTSGQVDAVLAAVPAPLLATFAQHEAEVVPALADLSMADTRIAMRTWKARAGALVEEAADERYEPPSSLYLSPVGHDQRYAISGELGSFDGQTVKTALRLAQTKEGPEELRRTPAQRRADALVDICRFFLDNQQSNRGGRHRPHLTVVVALASLEGERGGRFVDGPDIGAIDLSTLLCDCALHRAVTKGQSAPLDYGMSTRPSRLRCGTRS